MYVTVTYMKQCTICLKLQPLTNFQSAKTSRDGFHHQCKQCRASLAKSKEPERKDKLWKVHDDYTKVCKTCKQDKTIKNFKRSIHKKDGFENHCKECLKPIKQLKNKEARWNLRKQVLLAYGAKCICCGESELKFLAIDHIHNDGAKERKTVCSRDMLKFLIKNNYPKDRYQLLCHNCNMAKGFYGSCPHQSQ